MAGQFVQSVYNQIQDDTATVVFIIIGSDATQIRKRLSAHPFYKPECSIWCNELTVYSVRLMAMPLQYEYGCLMVRGYKTAETKKTRCAVHILDVIMLKYPLKVRPIPGIWVQSVPVTAIPWGGMNTEQRNTLQRSVRQDD